MYEVAGSCETRLGVIEDGCGKRGEREEEEGEERETNLSSSTDEHPYKMRRRETIAGCEYETKKTKERKQM